MSKWNHRVIKKTQEGETTFAIHEVFYTEGGEVTTWTERPVGVVGDNIEELRRVLSDMLASLDKPVLVEADADTKSVEKIGRKRFNPYRMTLALGHHVNGLSSVSTFQKTKASEDENRAKFMRYRSQQGLLIGGGRTRIFHTPTFNSYEEFKAEYLLIKAKKSQLPSKVRQEITIVWNILFKEES